MSSTKCIMRRRRGVTGLGRPLVLIACEVLLRKKPKAMFVAAPPPTRPVKRRSQVVSDGRGAAALSRPHFQPDADLSRIIFDEMNAGLLKSFLYFDDSREFSFLNAFVSFDALQGRQA
jgi:hypothetical protein